MAFTNPLLLPYLLFCSGDGKWFLFWKMSEKKASDGSSFSFTSDLFGIRDTSSLSSNHIFGPVFSSSSSFKVYYYYSFWSNYYFNSRRSFYIHALLSSGFNLILGFCLWGRPPRTPKSVVNHMLFRTPPKLVSCITKIVGRIYWR